MPNSHHGIEVVMAVVGVAIGIDETVTVSQFNSFLCEVLERKECRCYCEAGCHYEARCYCEATMRKSDVPERKLMRFKDE